MRRGRATSHPSALLAPVLLLVAVASAAPPEPTTESQAVLDDRYPPPRVQFPAGVTGWPDVVYSTIPGHRPLRLDLYLPSSSNDSRRRHPLIVYVHGGGWESGHTRHGGAFANWPEVLASVAARGFVVASVEYRLSREARFPAAVVDVQSALQWLRAQDARFAIDRERVALWGPSAGAQIAALAGLAPALAGSEPAAPRVDAIVAWYGVFDVAALSALGKGVSADATPQSRYLGCAPGECPSQLLEAASPIAQVHRDSPPLLLIHGLGDEIVPATQSRAMHERCVAVGARCELKLIEGAGHSFVARTAAATHEASIAALNRTIAFLEERLAPSARQPQ